LRKKLRRKEMVEFFQALAPTVIGNSKHCGSSIIGRGCWRSFGQRGEADRASAGETVR